LALLAFVVRAVVAAATSLTDHAYPLAPDQNAYMQISTLAAHGHLSPSVWAGYARDLYFNTFAYTGPLTVAIWLFGSHLILGQLLAAAFGTAAVVFSTLLAAEFVSRRAALLVGVVCALWPSQVLWSSLALKDSAVWAALAAMGYLISRLSRASSTRAALGTSVGILVSLVALSVLRRQTFLIAVWAVALTPWLVPMWRRWIVRAGAVLTLLLIPLVNGYGLAGYDVVASQAGHLGTIRDQMGSGAKSAVVGSHPRAESPTPTIPNTHTSSPPPSPALDDSVTSNISYLPRGIAAFLWRPFVWEPASSSSASMAKAETLIWWPVYLLAVAGVFYAYRRRRAVTVYLVLALGGLVGVDALIQGNLGTAFRQRGQLFFGLIVLAAVAAEPLTRAVARRLSSTA
jgi:hypothetical protein